MRRRSRRLWRALFVVTVIDAGCTFDFHRFDPTGTSDGGPAIAEGGADAMTSESGDPGETGPLPGDDATTDGTAPLEDASLPETDAPADVTTGVDGCVVPASCRSTASSCGTTCRNTRNGCESAFPCSINESCKQGCRSDESNCRAACSLACVECSSDAGCVSVPACNSALPP